uniref:Exportin-5 n=1 Tax=Ascaris suum TaxID=6253 RepID=F1KRF0_ASCSU
MMGFQLTTLVDAIRAIYDPNTNNERRIAASQLIESAKEANEAQSLADELISQDDLLIAHVGWNFVEHVIKFKWLELDATARISVRNGCFTQMASAQMAHAELRNAAARCVVAMIEHEWPQNWPELLEQLDQVASISTVHAQLPFIILQRLIENVVTMGTVENVARRKELNNAIAVQLPLILNMANNTLERCLNYSDDEWMLLARCALSLIGEVVEWASAKVLEPQLGVLLHSICAYLNKPQFSLYEYAARCLWRIASRRRAKNDENTIVLALFDDIPMRSMLTSANEAASVGVENVEHYRYLKALCDVLSALGIHLSDVWQRAPPNFEMYLSAIDAFLHHPSMYLRNEAASVLVSFISHIEIREDPLFNELISRVIIALPRLIEKIGLPSESGSPHSYYSQIDYDDDTQFMHDFIQFRDRCMRIVRSACVERHMGSLCKIVEEWIATRCIASPQSVSEIEWEAMQRYSRMVLSTYYEEGLLSEQHMQTFTELFDGVLSQVANCTNAAIINRLLSVLSSLFIILASHPDRLSPFLVQIRRLLIEVADDSTEDKSVRRHCISVLLRLITTFSDAIKSEAESILEVCISVRGKLSAMQQAACAHVLAALSNLCVDFQTQCTFLAATMQDCIAYFHSSEVTTAMANDSEFLSYIGFTLQAPQNSEEAQNSPFVANRRALRSNLSTMEGVLTQVRSVQPPAHPAFVIIRPILPTLFLLADRLKSLYEKECVQLIHPSYGSTVVDITESDRQQLISAVDPLATCSARILTDDPRSHARCFISDVTDCVQTITGLLANKMANELFAESSMESWSLQLVSHIPSTPDFRLRFWIRRSWRFVLCSCPELAYLKVREMLQRILSEMHVRLTTRWEQLAHIEITEEPSLEQLFTEHMACVLTRECVNLLRALINISDAISSNPDERKEEITCFITSEISRDKCIIDAVIALSFFFLTCRDATSAIRIIPVCRALVDIVKNMSNDQCCEEGVAVFMMVRSIQSLQVHGSDEIALGPLLSLVFHIYYSLRKCCVSLLRVLQQVPQCTEETLQSFDSRIISMITNNELVVEKVRREIVKKLLRPLIALSVGQQHKRPMHLRPLPPLAKRAKPLVEEDFTALALIFNTD